MKRIILSGILCLCAFISDAQISSLSQEEGTVSDYIIRYRRATSNPDAAFMQYITAPKNGVYNIKNLSIPHFDINYMVDIDKLAYSTSLVPGHPKHPSFKTNVAISKNSITITLEDNNIFLASDWDERGNAVRPKDPFKPVWGCMNTKTTYSKVIGLCSGINLPCKASYSCTHTSATLSRGTRQPGHSYSNDVVINGKVHRQGSTDYYPPVNFNHKQTITYSIPQMAQNMNMTDREIAALIVLHGVLYIPLNKEYAYWNLSETHQDIITYTLSKLYNFDEKYLISFEQSLNNRFEQEFEVVKELSTSVYRLITKESDAAKVRNEFLGYEKKMKKILPLLSGSRDYAISTLYVNNTIKAHLATTYALDGNFEAMNNVIKDALSVIEEWPFPVVQNFWRSMCHGLFNIGASRPMAHYTGQMFAGLIKNDEALELYSRPKYELEQEGYSDLFSKYIMSTALAMRQGDNSQAENALYIYKQRKEKLAPIVKTIDPSVGIFVCEISFHNAIDKMLKILDETPINRQTVLFPARQGGYTLTKLGMEFYAYYMVALESYNKFLILYRELYDREPTEESSKIFAGMKKTMNEKFLRTSQEAAFDREILDAYSNTNTIQDKTGIMMVEVE